MKNIKNVSKYLTPFQRKLLEKSLQTNLNPKYHCRIQIMLLADVGYTKAQISKTLGCTQETARYWIGQARSGQAHNWNDCPIGRPKVTSEEYLERLKELVSNSPRDYGYSFERWTGQWLSKHLSQELGIEVTARHVNRLLKQMGLSSRSKSVENSATDNSKDNSNLVLCKLPSVSTPGSHQMWQLNFFG